MTHTKKKHDARKKTAEVRRLDAEVIRAAFWWKHKYDKSGCAFSDALNRTANEYADAARETESGKREMVLEEQLVAARAQLVTAREDALEEAKKECLRVASEWLAPGPPTEAGILCATRVGALKKTKGGGA